MDQLDLFTQPSAEPLPGLHPTTVPSPTSSRQARTRRAARGLTPRRLADRITECVVRAWHSAPTDSGHGIPLGVIAALAQISQPHHGPDIAAHLLALNPEELWQVLERVWAMQWIRRPELVHWAAPLHTWLQQEPDAWHLGAVHAVAQAALESGQLELTGNPEPLWRCDVDLLGTVLTGLRAHGARQVLGEYHTPPDIAAVMARFTLGAREELKPGQWFDEPAAGTGGLFRALAQHLRETGRDPRDYGWSMGEIDPLAAACCAVNAIVWGLGPNVLVACTDTLAEGNGAQRALAERRKLYAHRDRLLACAKELAAWRDAFTALESLITSQGRADHPGRASSPPTR